MANRLSLCPLLQKACANISTSPEKRIRNGGEAVRLAKLIINETGQNTPSKMDLLAAALAEINQFEEASDLALKAYKLALKTGKTHLAADIFQRQKLYNTNRPYRDLN